MQGNGDRKINIIQKSKINDIFFILYRLIYCFFKEYYFTL